MSVMGPDHSKAEYMKEEAGKREQLVVILQSTSSH